MLHASNNLNVSTAAPRLIVGAVYKQTGETMKLLWTDKLCLNTVHVHDVARALWHLSQHGAVGQTYNLADKGDSSVLISLCMMGAYFVRTDQGSVTDLVSQLFAIKSDYAGTLLSNFAKLNMTSVTEDVNDGHMEPWSQMCGAAGIENTPLSPYLDKVCCWPAT